MFLFCLRGQNHFCRFLFFVGTLEKDLVLYVEKLGCEFAAILSHLFSSLILLCKFALIWPETHPSSYKGKTDEVCIFSSEAAICWCFSIQVFLNFLQYSQEKNTNVIKKRLQCRCFPVNIAKNFKNSFFINTSGGCFSFLKLQCMNVRYFEWKWWYASN